MEVEYYEECEGSTRLGIRQERTKIHVTHGEKRGPIRLTVRSQAGDDCCDRVETSLEVCFSCEEWMRLLCELRRVNCWPRDCDPCEEWFHDEDECCEDEPRRGRDERVTAILDEDDDDECEPRSILVSVAELRKAIKGCGADDLVEISE